MNTHFVTSFLKETKLLGLRLERTTLTERLLLVGEVSANFFLDRGCHVVSATDTFSHILAFLDRSRYFFFQVAAQLYSRG
jgi:hypothetical protein